MRKFPDIFKNAEITPVDKTNDMNDNKTIVQWVHYPIYQKYLKNFFIFKLVHIWVINSQNI